jgi:carboxypeptidase Q
MRQTTAFLHFVPLLFLLPASAQEHPDLSVVDRIKSEAFDRSKVMDTLYQITDVRGPRLTGSPQFDEAARWTMSRLKEYGLENVHPEHWGPFGRAWSIEQSSLEVIEPGYERLVAAPLAWSAPTKDAVTGELIIAPLTVSFRDGPKKVREGMDAYKAKWTGKLRGRIVLLNEPKVPKPQTNPQFRRYTDADLQEMAAAPAPAPRSTAQNLNDLEWPEDRDDLGKLFNSLPNRLMDQLYDLYDSVVAERGAFFAKEGAAGVLLEDDRAHEGRLAAEAAGGFKMADTAAPATFVVTAEQYDRIARAVDRKIPFKVRLNLRVKTSDRDVDGANIVAEIPGSGDKKDEIVMIGAHFDSWHTATGATDNGAGSAVMIEVMRILKTLNLKMDRTVRIALWSGEEQGLFGSRAYVKEHFADPKTMQVTAEHARISGYFNLDNGSGKIRGVYLQGNEAMRPLFENWLAPFRDLGVATITIRNTGGTDHQSFDAVGIPGFQFIQDPLDYGSVTHHTNMDTYDHAIPEDLMQASAVIASVVYDAANRKDMLPRRELPKP